MTDTNRGECSFLKTHAGVTAFARVRVKFTPDPDSGRARVQLALAEQPDRDNGEVDVRTAPDWCRAALEGVTTAFSILGDVPPGVVAITLVQGSVVDTTVDAVSCAAGLAAAQLFGRDPIPISDVPPWHLMRNSL